ncbi:hypothetical protein [uncultured Cloacibacillus sp.]|uniref:hypothetical protein n=1 Tax=uncultured Cloacibacillus sp. TaxID=889794 RepID=UPI0026DA6FA9|nr:hypothetical protein [uncultured Cloacibacillus sp.]
MAKSGFSLNNIFGKLSKKEKDVYISIYFMLAFAIVLIVTSAGSGLITARELINVLNSQSNTEVVRSIGNSAGELKDMQQRLQLIKQQFESIKYPDRSMMRDSINKDLSAIGFAVQSITLRDLPLDVISQRVANGPRPSDGSRINPRDIPSMIEVTITGTLPFSATMPFFKLADRTDRFWYIDKLDVNPPDGIVDFFGKSFMQMPVAQKKEMFDTFDSYTDTDNPYMTVTFSFYTLVKSGN